MKAITLFYVKASAKLACELFILGVVCNLVLTFLPFEAEGKKVLIICLNLILIPGYYFFSHKTLLSKSLEWILQTPIQKSQIIYSNAIINLLKLVLVILIVDSLNYLFTSNKDLSVINILSSGLLILLTEPTSLDEKYGVLTLIGLILTLCFGIFRNKNSRTKEYRFPVDRFGRKQIKTASILVASLLLGFFFVPILVQKIPQIILLISIYSLFASAMSVATLHAINRDEFPSRTNFSVLTIFLSFVTVISFYWAHEDYSSKGLSINSKIKTHRIMGGLYPRGRELIIEQMIEGKKNLRPLTGSYSDTFFNKATNREIEIVSDSWVKLCRQRKDFTCGLLPFLRINGKPVEKLTDYLRLACPSDLRSCYFLSIQSLDEAEKKSLHSALTKTCSTELKDPVDRQVCWEFNRPVPGKKK